MRPFFLLILSFYFSSLFSNDIAVVTLAIGKSYREAVALGIENKKEYCRKHGYDFFCEEESLDSTRLPGWNKMLILLKTMENSKYKWLFWSDADSLFMNFSLPIEHLLDENYQLIITQDMFEINPGQILIRNNQWGRQFLTDVYSHIEFVHSPGIELGALIAEIGKMENKPFVKILPQRSMNSYAREVIGFYPSSVLRESLYKPGDFILHFSGEHHLGRLKRLLEKYSKEVIKEN